MLKESAKEFWEQYKKMNRNKRIELLKDCTALSKRETTTLQCMLDNLQYIRIRWESSAEMYDEQQALNALHKSLIAHVKKYAHTMSPELLAYVMQYWAAVNTYLKAVNSLRTFVESNQDIATVLDLIRKKIL